MPTLFEHAELYMQALDEAGMPSDAAFREAVREHVESGSRVAMQNSHATTEAELHPLREVPRWTWGGDDPRS
jgi:hemoglobin